MFQRSIKNLVLSQHVAKYAEEIPYLKFEDHSDQCIPVKRPHFSNRDGKLFFLISSRPHEVLLGEEAGVWDAIDGSRSIAELERKTPGARQLLAKWWERELIELREPKFSADRRKALVIEPHMDDAVLSIGGTMWSRRHETCFTVLTVASVSNYTSYHKLFREYFNPEAVSELRRRESELVMDLVGGKIETLGRVDSALRYEHRDWTAEWFLANNKSVTAYMNHSMPPAVVESLADELAERFRASEATELWFPIGIGRAADHEATRNACLLALQKNPDLLSKFNVFIYQDVPYLAEFPDHATRLRAEFNKAGGVLEPNTHDISEVLPNKLRMVSIFASQFKIGHMGPKVAEAAHQTADRTGLTLAETFFKLRTLPQGRLDDQLYSARNHVEAIRHRLRSWYPKARNARHLHIVSPLGIGCWESDMQALLNAFPQACINIHLPRQAVNETQRFLSERITVKTVSGGAREWGSLLIKLALTTRDPIVVATSFKLAKLAPLVKLALFFANVLPVSNIDNLVGALRLLDKSIRT